MTLAWMKDENGHYVEWANGAIECCIFNRDERLQDYVHWAIRPNLMLAYEVNVPELATGRTETIDEAKQAVADNLEIWKRDPWKLIHRLGEIFAVMDGRATGEST